MSYVGHIGLTVVTDRQKAGPLADRHENSCWKAEAPLGRRPASNTHRSRAVLI